MVADDAVQKEGSTLYVQVLVAIALGILVG